MVQIVICVESVVTWNDLDPWCMSQELFGSSMEVRSPLEVPISIDSACSSTIDAALPDPSTAGIWRVFERAIRIESKVMCGNSPFSFLEGIGPPNSDNHEDFSTSHAFSVYGWQV